MMPAYCPESAPPGEWALYQALSVCPDTDGWVVLHSLAIADHLRQVEGETDFVVIVPGKGIVVIEVKSHHQVGVLDDGSWKLGNSAPTVRSPFQQAKEAMYSIRQYLQQRKTDLRAIPMVYAVWFTHVRARNALPCSPEWHEWQVLDSEDLRRGVSAAILRTLAKGAEHLVQAIPNFSSRNFGPDEKAAERLASTLRPRFEMFASAGDRRLSRMSELVTFIEEQYRALDAMSDNQAVLFTGPAGSGKTFLAIEAARREAKQGRKGRLLCFNSLLGRRLRQELGEIPGLAVGTVHQEMLKLADVDPPHDANSRYWGNELPDRVLEMLLDGRHDPAADFLIVDEVQDIARGPFLDFLDLLIVGGLRDGRLLLFGDFERQAIFESDDGRALLKERSPYLAYNRIVTNCRNLPRIGYVVNAFSRLQLGYENFRRQDDGIDPTFLTYEAGSDQSAQLVESVRQLRSEGFDLHEITVLSVLRSGSTAESTSDPWLCQVLHQADGSPPRPGRLQFSTVHAFKGLESPAVVMTDLDRRVVPNIEALLYVGFTRATDRLVVMIESSTLRKTFGGRT